MALPTPTTPTLRANVNDIFNTEYITNAWRMAAMEPEVGQLVVKEVSASLEELNSLTYQVPILAEVTGVAAITPGAAAPEAALSTDPATVTLTRKGLSMFIYDDTKSKVMRATEAAMMSILRAHRKFVSDAILALFTSITGTQGNATTVNDLANFDSAMQAHRAQLITPGPLFAVMNPDPIRDLRADIITNAAALFGAAWGERAADALQKPQTGLMTSFGGYTLIESTDCPVGDTTGWTSALLVGGEDAWAELVIAQDIEAELERAAQFYGTWLVGGMVTGVGIIKQTQAYKFVSQT